MRHDPATTLLYRSISQKELDLIAAANWLVFPPCMPEQPVFHLTLDQEYAAEMARDWHAPHHGVDYVLRFAVDADYAAQLPVQSTGHQRQEELRVPAEELAEFNRHLVGQIEVVAVL